MLKGGFYRFGMRFLAILAFHFVIKAGDLTYGKFTDFTFRGLLFSFFFMSYWLLVWHFSDVVSKQIYKWQEQSLASKKFFTNAYFTFHTLYSFFAAWLFNHLYRWADITFFDMKSSWLEVTVLNPELTFSLWIFYIVIFSFETYSQSLLKQKEDQLQLEKLEQEHTLALYDNLKSQIEPHFLFNSLSVLSSIVHTDVNLASEFILKLSKMLRYVVEKKEYKLLPLKDELAFVNNYLFLMQTRFTDGIVVGNELNDTTLSSCYLPSVSLQLLIENAIKHNKFSKESPLYIDMYPEGGYLVVRNNLNKRNDQHNSTKQGLDNLSKRYAHFTTKKIEIKESNDSFIVALPMLKAADNFQNQNELK